MTRFERLGSEVAWRGRIVSAGTERFRFADGAVVVRDKVWHPGAVGILAVDEAHVWLTRQPREAAGIASSLEVPAGKLDVPGEKPLACARRELAEEVGKEAASWRELYAFHTSPGFTDERVWLFVATDLSDTEAGAPEHEEDERIEVVPWRLDRLEEAIDACDDSKTLIALLWLSRARSGGGAQAPARAAPAG